MVCTPLLRLPSVKTTLETVTSVPLTTGMAVALPKDCALSTKYSACTTCEAAAWGGSVIVGKTYSGFMVVSPQTPALLRARMPM